jgi:CheY-like chemotaxis protein
VALRKGVALDCVCEPGVETPVVGDPLRLRQVLLNLLGNALKFTDRGQVELRITRIARRQESAVLLFAVRDSGIGIPPSLQTQLFKPFVQAEEGAARKGTGLGLAISQKLVNAMGGDITVESRAGRGSTFSFDLELPFAPADAAAALTPVASASAEPTRSLSGRVLLVEDNPVNRLVATTMLAPMGLEVTECEDGQQALERLREQPYDLVLMDCQMPVLDGFGATAAIRTGEAGADRSRVPIVAFTANALDGDAERCLAAGMDGYLSKPFTREQLATAVGIWLGATSDHGVSVSAATRVTAGPDTPLH